MGVTEAGHWVSVSFMLRAQPIRSSVPAQLLTVRYAILLWLDFESLLDGMT